jgi:hypothetical protein
MARLDGAARDAEQPAGLTGGEAVEHGGADDGPQLRGQPVEGRAELAVLEAEQHLLLGRADDVDVLRHVEQAAAGRGLRRTASTSRRTGDAPEPRATSPRPS